MIEEVNILLHRINGFNIFLIQGYQRVHGAVQVVGGKTAIRSAPCPPLTTARSRIENGPVPDIFQREIVAVVHLHVLARHEEIGHFDDQAGKREKRQYLEHLENSMGVGHETSRVGAGNNMKQIDNRPMASLRMIYINTVPITLNRKWIMAPSWHPSYRSWDASSAEVHAADITAEYDKQTNGKLQQPLICHQQHNTYRYRELWITAVSSVPTRMASIGLVREERICTISGMSRIPDMALDIPDRP